MTNSNLVRSLILIFFSVTVISCVENEQQFSPRGKIASRTIFNPNDRGGWEGIPESGGSWNYPYPDIIEREFIPSYPMFDDTKCLAWRITWPSYNASADDTKIPTVFATMNGALNSFNYLNNVSAANTHKTDFSLYYENKVNGSATMWAELDYADGALMEVPSFALSNQPLENIIDWVTERPDLFEFHWPGGGTPDLSYNEGDFIQFWFSKSGLYGGIRIVSMSPRIIEVYLAVPNI